MVLSIILIVDRVSRMFKENITTTPIGEYVLIVPGSKAQYFFEKGTALIKRAPARPRVTLALLLIGYGTSFT